MRVHKTMCSGHRPLSSPRPMADPTARHRPSPERGGRRLPGPLAEPLRCAFSGPRALPAGQMCGPDGAPARQREGSLRLARRGEAPGGRGELRRRPAPAPAECARGVVVGPGARVTHSTSAGAAGGNRKLLANSWAGPLTAGEPSPAPRFQPSRSLVAANHVPRPAPPSTLANFQLPLTALRSSWLRVLTPQ